MATSGSIVTNGYQGSSVYRRARLEWTSTSSGTVSTINWTFSMENSDGSGAVSYVTSQAYFDISLAKGTLSDGSTSRRVQVLSYNTGRYLGTGVIGSGSFTITHDSEANARMTLTPYVSVYVWDAEGSARYSGTGTFDLPQLYGKLSIPSGFTFICSSNTDYLKLENDSISFGWFPPSNGANNEVIGYDLYLKCSSNGANPSLTDYTFTTYLAKSSLPALASNGSQWVSVSLGSNLATASRGQIIRAGIRVRGSAGANYYSSLNIASATRYINRLPDAPSGSNKTILSTQTNTSLSVSPGNANDSGQTSSVYYTLTASKPSSPSGATAHTDARAYIPGTYYFWSYDGLEFSDSSLALSVIKNVKPTLSLLCEPVEAVSSKMADVSTHIYAPSLKITPTINKTSNYSITYRVYGYSGWDSTPIGASWVKNELLGTAVSNSPITYKVLSKIGHGKSYMIAGKLWDGLEYSDEVFVSSSNSKYFSTAPWPEKIGIYNRHSNSNVDETGTYFYDKIRFLFDYDEAILSGDYCYATCSTEDVPVNYSFSADDKVQMYVDITVARGLTQNKSYSFDVQLTDGSNEKKIYSGSFLQVPLYSGVILSNSSIWYPFTQENDATFSLSKFAEEKDHYVLADNWLTISLANGSNIFDFATGATIDDGINDAFTVSQSPDKLLSLLDGIGSLNGIYGLEYYATVRNKFGVEVRVARATSSQNLSVNFNSVPTLDFLPENVCSVEADGSTVQLSNYICEGLNLTFLPTIKVYNGTYSTIYVDIARSNTNSSGGLSWTQFCSFDVTHPSIKPTYKNPVAVSISSASRVTVGELSSNETYCFFRVRLKNGDNSEVAQVLNDVSYKRVRHISANISLESAQYDEGEVSLQYSCSDFGCATSSSDSKIKITGEISLQYSTTELSEASAVESWIDERDFDTFATGTSATITHAFGSGDSFQKVRLLISTTIETTYATGKAKSITKTAYSNEFLVYNQNPTVALRQNYIGINRRSFPTDSVVIIGSTTGRPKIVFQGADSTCFINIETGEIDGFVLDGGTW